MFTTKFMSVGNPDKRQDPGQELYNVPSVDVEVSTLAEVRDKWIDWIYKYDLGGGNTIPTLIFDDYGNTIARISYNGRFWDPETGEEIVI